MYRQSCHSLVHMCTQKSADKHARYTRKHMHTHTWLCRHWHPSHLVKLNLSTRWNSCRATHVHVHACPHVRTITHSSGKQQKISWSKLVHLQTGMSRGTSDPSVAACGRKSGSSHCLMCPKSICREQRKQVLWCMYVCIPFLFNSSNQTGS